MNDNVRERFARHYAEHRRDHPGTDRELAGRIVWSKVQHDYAQHIAFYAAFDLGEDRDALNLYKRLVYLLDERRRRAWPDLYAGKPDSREAREERDSEPLPAYCDACGSTPCEDGQDPYACLSEPDDGNRLIAGVLYGPDGYEAEPIED